jgi:hypothetical protein
MRHSPACAIANAGIVPWGLKMFRLLSVVALACAGLTNAAVAQEIKLGDIKAQFWLEGSGRLSDDVLAMSNPKLVNLPRAEGVFGEPVNTVVISIPFLGAKNTQPKHASANVNIITINRTGQRRMEARPQLGFVFGESGIASRAIILENITCSKVEVEVKTRSQTKRAKLDFTCMDPAPEIAAAPAQQPKR